MFTKKFNISWFYLIKKRKWIIDWVVSLTCTPRNRRCWCSRSAVRSSWWSPDGVLESSTDYRSMQTGRSARPINTTDPGSYRHIVRYNSHMHEISFFKYTHFFFFNQLLHPTPKNSPLSMHVPHWSAFQKSKVALPVVIYSKFYSVSYRTPMIYDPRMILIEIIIKPWEVGAGFLLRIFLRRCSFSISRHFYFLNFLFF